MIGTTGLQRGRRFGFGFGLVFVEAAAAQGRSGAELEVAVREVVASIAAAGVSAEELNRARVQLLAQLVYKRDSFFAQALELGELEASGLSFRDADRIAGRLKEITADQIRAVAARFPRSAPRSPAKAPRPVRLLAPSSNS